jgi:hypothetical protein
VGSIATCGLKNRHRCRRRAMSACWAGSSGTTPVRIARTSRCAYDRFRASGRSENGRLKHRSDITPVKSGSRQLDWKRSFAFLPCAVHSRASQRSSLRALVRCRLEAARASGFAASPCPSRPLAPRTRSHFGATGPREPSGCKNPAGRVRIPLAARRRGALVDLGRALSVWYGASPRSYVCYGERRRCCVSEESNRPLKVSVGRFRPSAVRN